MRERLRRIRWLRWTWRLGWKIFIFMKQCLPVKRQILIWICFLKIKSTFWLEKVESSQLEIEARRSRYFLMKLFARVLKAQIPPQLLFEKYMGYASNLWHEGKQQKSLAYLQKAERAKTALIKHNGWGKKNFIFLAPCNRRAIGGIAHVDAFVKRKILMNDHRIYYLLAPEHDIVNPEALNYFSSYIQIVTDPEEIRQLSVYETVLRVNWDWAIPGDDGMDFAHYGMAKVQRQWYTEGRKPLLELNPSHRNLGEDQKKRWRMKESDWFICLHVRYPGYYSNSEDNTQDYRNTPIEDYGLLIDAVTEKGGWVVRMGHPSAPRLDKNKYRDPDRVIDYAHLPERSSALDVALSAMCRLFVSSSTGLHGVAKCFGIPSLYINAPMFRGFPHSPASIFILPFYYSHEKERVLTIEEIFSSNLVYADSQKHYDQLHVSLRHVEPEDMVSVLDEALSLVDDINFAKGYHVNHIENNFDRLNQKYEMCINGRIGKHFLEKYGSQLGLLE